VIQPHLKKTFLTGKLDAPSVNEAPQILHAAYRSAPSALLLRLPDAEALLNQSVRSLRRELEADRLMAKEEYRHTLLPLTSVVRYALECDPGLTEQQRHDLLPIIVAALLSRGQGLVVPPIPSQATGGQNLVVLEQSPEGAHTNG